MFLYGPSRYIVSPVLLSSNWPKSVLFAAAFIVDRVIDNKNNIDKIRNILLAKSFLRFPLFSPPVFTDFHDVITY